MRHFSSLDELEHVVGEHLGHSPWLTVTQPMVTMFSEASGDHQWIHVDEERANSGPFGGTIVPGYLTLALLPMLTMQIIKIDGVGMEMNVGLNKVRFHRPILVGSRIRAGAKLLETRRVPSGLLVSVRMTVQAEGEERTMCVADTLSLFSAGSGHDEGSGDDEGHGHEERPDHQEGSGREEGFGSEPSLTVRT